MPSRLPRPDVPQVRRRHEPLRRSVHAQAVRPLFAETAVIRRLRIARCHALLRERRRHSRCTRSTFSTLGAPGTVSTLGARAALRGYRARNANAASTDERSASRADECVCRCDDEVCGRYAHTPAASNGWECLSGAPPQPARTEGRTTSSNALPITRANRIGIRDPARSAASSCSPPTRERTRCGASTGVCHSSCETMKKLVIVNAPYWRATMKPSTYKLQRRLQTPRRQTGIPSVGPTRSCAHMPARRSRARICMRMRAVSRAAGPSWCARKARVSCSLSRGRVGSYLSARQTPVDAAVPSRECGVHVSGHTRAHMHHMLRRRLPLCSARHPIDAAAIGLCRRGPV